MACKCLDPAVWGHVTPCGQALPAPFPPVPLPSSLDPWYPIPVIDGSGK